MAFACTDFKENDYIPDSISTDVQSLTFDAKGSPQKLVLESGREWTVNSCPGWLTVKSADNNGSPYRWSLTIEAEPNSEYDREGVIIFSAKEQSASVSVFQAGAHGAYVKVSGISVTERISLSVGEEVVLEYIVEPNNASDKSVSYQSSNSSVAAISEEGRITAISTGIAIMTVTTVDGGFTADCEVTVGPKAVDLGLSVKWASCNVGATDPTGNAFYAWGEKETKTTYLWGNYGWCKGSGSSITKYNTDSANGSVDYKTVLDFSDDVAAADWGGNWRIPTKGEWEELINPANCTWTWIQQNGVLGYNVTGKRTGSEKSIFLPAAGSTNGAAGGFYWSSNLVINSPECAVNVHFTKEYVNSGSTNRNCGLSIRPVFGEFVQVSGLTLNPNSIDLEVGETATITATVNPANATCKDVTWLSDNPSVATVSSTGVVTANGVGTATISVIASDGATNASCVVSVSPATVYVESVSLDKTELELTVGDTERLTATVLPEDATDPSVTWSSDAPEVASVSETGVVSANGVGTATITVTTNDGEKTASCVVSVAPVIIAVESVNLDKTELEMTVGDTEQLMATVLPEDATDPSVTWSSDAPEVASVSETGVVSANGVGTATITVTTNDGDKTASCAVSVSPVIIAVESVNLDKTELGMTAGDTKQLTASVLPEDATDPSVTWSSDAPEVASVSETGVITANSVGTATITVTTNDGNKTASCVVYVSPVIIAVESVNLDKTKLEMTAGDTEQLTATVLPEDATDPSVSWSSNNPEVASVSEAGEVTANAAGSAIITVTTNEGNKTATCLVLVSAATIPVTGVLLDKNSLSLIEGQTFVLTATVLPANATDQFVYWSSSDPSVASVSETGEVSALSEGTATITVTTDDGEKTASCVVTVSPIVVKVESVSLDKTDIVLTVGDTEQLTATVLPKDATDKSVIWSSDAPEVASVSEAGEVTANAAGAAIITVTTNDGNKTATCAITVSPLIISVESVSLDKTNITMTVGDTEVLTATVVPEDATDPSVIWSSNNSEVASVTESGEVTANAAGSAIITVTTVDGNKTATCLVLVSAATIPVTSVLLDKNSLTLIEEETAVLTASVLPDNATDQSVSWSSSDPSVATVSDSGEIVAVAEGTATIIVTTNDGAWTSSCEVTVKPKAIAVECVTLSADNLRIKVGDTEQLTATVMPDNATDKSVSWTSDNDEVATVDSNGLVTAVSSGVAIITASAAGGEKTAECMVEVYCPVSSITLDKTEITLMAGETDTLTATVEPAEADQTVIWSTSDEEVAIVDTEGKVIAVGSGTAVITVTSESYPDIIATCSVSVYVIIPVTAIDIQPKTLPLYVEDSATIEATVSPADATDRSLVWSSNNPSVAKVDDTGTVQAVSPGSATITCTSGGYPDISAICYVTVNKRPSVTESVDLGLSVKWAPFNVGASKPEEYGDYFAWGETEPYYESGSAQSDSPVWKEGKSTGYAWESYEWCNGTYDSLTKYCTSSSYGEKDDNTILEAEDDVASVKWGGNWRQPSYDELEELRNPDNCTWSWTTRNGISGYLVTSKIEGYTGNSIFLPAAGIREDTRLRNAGKSCRYWSSIIPTIYPYYSCVLFFSSSEIKSSYESRYMGSPVRPVYGALVRVTGVTLDLYSLTLTAGESTVLTASVLPFNATDKTVFWSSSNTSVATVSDLGEVTALSQGSAIITVKTNDGAKTAKCSITVRAAQVTVSSVTLSRGILRLIVGASEQLTATVLPENAPNKKVSWSSDKTSVATVDQNGLVKGIAAGTAKITVTSESNPEKKATCTVTITEPQAVDLGLSVKWASFNVGALAPEEYGDYFAWGETEPKDNYSWSTYKWCNGEQDKLTKYCTYSSYWDSSEPMDNKTVLDPEDDAASANWGGSWRMPTDAEWTELKENCNWTWTIQNEVEGRLVTSKKNGNSIFLPAAGYRYGTNIDYVGSRGLYWFSSLYTGYPYDAWYVCFYFSYVGRSYYGRCYGQSVRPVYDDRIHPKSISLDMSTLSLYVGESITLRAIIFPSNATDKSVTWSSNNTDVATVDDGGKVIAVKEGTATITVTTNDGNLTASCQVTVSPSGPKAIDLGLSVKWATFNVGATSPEEYGVYFAWGETEPYYISQHPLIWKDGKASGYYWPSYKWCKGDNDKLTKYCTQSEYWDRTEPIDNKTTLDLEDDAARANCGGSWRMPTDAEWTELRENCIWTWTTQNGVNGLLVTSNKTGYTDKSIFFPAASGWVGTSLYNVGLIGYYWTSSLVADNPSSARAVYFSSDGIERSYYSRFYGWSVRPVTE